MTKLTKREAATVLAALRYLQANADDVEALELDHFKGVKMLSYDEIDRLCERINIGDGS